MTTLTKQIDDLETRIAAASGDDRLALMARLETCMKRLSLSGSELSEGHQAGLSAPTDESVEAQFDNMPV